MKAAAFCLATSFEDELIEGVRGLPVSNLYGKVEGDGFGGGRPNFLVPKIGCEKRGHTFTLTLSRTGRKTKNCQASVDLIRESVKVKV